MVVQQPLAFGELLKRYRLSAGLTQERLAERAGMSARAVSDLERGVHRAPQEATLQLLARALGLSGQQHAALAATMGRARPSATGAEALPGAAGLGPTGPAPHTGLIPHAPAAAAPLVGREPELAQLERHLAGQGPPMLLLSGEPGIGKSRLLAEAARRAPGWTVLACGCQRRVDQEPFAPLLGALQGYLHGCAPTQRRAALHDCAWLVCLLPELVHLVSAPFPAWTLPPEQERRLMFAAVARFLANVAGPAGTLLVLDDLQWAGADALELLASLLHATAQPVRVLGAYRSTEVGPRAPLAVALADLAHAGLATQLTLGPLMDAEAEHLLDALLREVEPVDARLRAQLRQRAGGVPFFALSCVRALRPGVQEPAPLPWDLRHSIRQRVAALAVEAQEVLGVAAVIGRRVAPGLLTAVAARPREVVLAALEAAGRAQLLVEEPDAAAYQFPHDVIREVLEADVGVARRADLHRRVALALEEQSAPPCDAAQARPSLPVRHRVVAGARGSTRRSWTERQRWALEHLRTAGPLSPRAYATAVSVSVDTALRDLQELVDQGLVQTAGTTRDRRYVLAGDAAVPVIRRTPP